MDILKFTLHGKTAFFKKPEVNTYVSFTYSNIHKVTLLGMFGAILGYDGYAAMDKENDEYPEFYKKLHHIKCAIVPKHQNGYAGKKIQQFNNSVGYASQELGGNLIVKEQWLENPTWDIYVAIDSEEARKLSEAIVSHTCVYIPYLGKNDHPANIVNVKLFRDCQPTKKYIWIDSLCLQEYVSYGDIEEDEYEEDYYNIKEFKYQEVLPIALNQATHMYESKLFVHSNLPVSAYRDDVYKPGEDVIVFY